MAHAHTRSRTPRLPVLSRKAPGARLRGGAAPEHTGRPPWEPRGRSQGRRGREERKGRTLPRCWAMADGRPHSGIVLRSPLLSKRFPLLAGETIPGSLALPPRDLCENPPPPLVGEPRLAQGQPLGSDKTKNNKKPNSKLPSAAPSWGPPQTLPAEGLQAGVLHLLPHPPRSLMWASISSRASPPLGGVGRAAWAVSATAEVLGVSRPMVRQGQPRAGTGSRTSALLLWVLRPFPAKTLHLLN